MHTTVLTRIDGLLQIFLATKFGNHVTPEGGREIRNEPEYIRQSVAMSLERLKTDYIDLLYV
jgi:aryl-alcohol dehydrogenase-like predicted oxidoreductase